MMISRTKEKNYMEEISEIRKSIDKHEELNGHEQMPEMSLENISLLEANFLWIMNTLNLPFNEWKSLFSENPDYLKRLSDISMTHNFEMMVREGEAIEIFDEIDGSLEYIKKEEYNRICSN